jgi:arginase
MMGPDAYRTAGLAEALEELGHKVEDRGNIAIPKSKSSQSETHLYKLAENQLWTETLAQEALHAIEEGLPIFLGGDHALTLGTGLGVAQYAARQNRPQFVLWIDAHSDFHTPQTTDSGNIHGTPLAYLTGREGFAGFPQNTTPIPQENIAIFGLRSVDAAERTALMASNIRRHDMRDIDEHGIVRPLKDFLKLVASQNGLLHVSLDVDFLDPSVAPAVGTTVPGGATVREAHLIMELVHESGLMSSLDLVELNPFLDERGRTASLMVELAASALGRKVFDRPTLGYVA